MMLAGRMVWSRSKDGSWYVHSDDGEFLYTATRFERHWKVEVRQRQSPASSVMYFPPVEIGSPASTLTLAKRLADEHHHLHIRKDGSLELHEYILRYPL